MEIIRPDGAVKYLEVTPGPSPREWFAVCGERPFDIGPADQVRVFTFDCGWNDPLDE